MSYFAHRDADIIIVGGGVAGCSAAYHLTQAGATVTLLEAGRPGDGKLDPVKIPKDTFTRDGDRTEADDSAFQFAERSGTAVLPTVETIKMMVNLYASSTEDFIRHHGEDGARRYLKLAAEGIRIEKELAGMALANPDKDLRSLGSLYVCEAKDRDDFRKEFEDLKRLGCPGVELWEKRKVQQYSGGKYADFELGIFFPYDAVINSAQFCKDLLALIQRSHPGALSVRDGCSPVKSISQVNPDSGESYVLVTLEDGTTLTGKQAVVATGGLFMDPALAGILKPCWSYLVGITTPQTRSGTSISCAIANAENTFTEAGLAHPHSVNLFTWGFTHDWCSTDGFMRVSGEDHFSALKPPRMKERCASLARWTYEKYPYLLPPGIKPQVDSASEIETAAFTASSEASNYASQYGVYSETPDAVPLVGSLANTSTDRIFYCLGCNAWGQAVLSYSASLMPGLMGITELDVDQRDLFELLTIRRFCLLPGNKN